MTQPGGPTPQGAPQTQTPPPWPPQQPAWPAPPQGPWAPQVAAPVPPKRDSTRVIAITALVVSVVTLLGVLATSVLPLLFFGLFATAFGGGFGEALGDESLLSSVGTVYGGEVTPAADGSVAGPTLAGAVVPLVSGPDEDADMAERVSCDAVPRVAAGTSVLCRASDPDWFGIVRFTGTDGSFDVVTVGDDGWSTP